jgi:hypothetical protein
MESHSHKLIIHAPSFTVIYRLHFVCLRRHLQYEFPLLTLIYGMRHN